jgi:oxygen-independent coproporphyrinogen-3 oxidase
LVEGFEAGLFETRTGLAWSELSVTIGGLEERGLLESIPGQAGGWRPTELGRRFLNDVITEFLPTRPGV